MDETKKLLKNVKVLDCSIRDGGHLNDWNFDSRFVKKLFDAVSESGTEFIELGYRTTPGLMDKSGKWRNIDDETLNLIVPEHANIKIALMGDVGKIKDEDFKNKDECQIDMIRLAFYQHQLDEALELTEKLFQKGYLTTLNLMGIVKYSQEQLENAINKLKKSNVDIIYVADSFGSLFPHEVAKLVKLLKESTGKKIGFHPHNNLQLGFANTIAAMEAGAEYVDASVNGMGRGAGNLPLETILLFFNKHSRSRYNLIPILELIESDVRNLKSKIGWGYDSSYLLSGINNCHPKYVQELMKRNMDINEIFSVLDKLKKIKSDGFDKEVLEKAINDTVTLDKDKLLNVADLEIEIIPKKPDYIDDHKGKKILIIANGPSLNQNEDRINEFIEKNNPIILGSNFLGEKIIPHYHIFNSFERFKQYIPTVHKSSKVLIGGYLFERLKKMGLSDKFQPINYVAKKGFTITDGIIYTDPSTVVILMIALANVLGADEIYVAGMDGYKERKSTHFYSEKEVSKLENINTLQHKMEENLDEIAMHMEENGKKPFVIITPTSFKKYYKEGII